MIPEQIRRFVAIFEKLPSIGPRQATRLAFRLIAQGANTIAEAKNAMAGLSDVRVCPRCFFVYAGTTACCSLCANEARQKCFFMVLEKETDLISIERTGSFLGRYLVLGELARSGVLEPWQKMRLSVLKKIIATECGGSAEEIILALNPTTYGDVNASLIQKELEEHAKKISRLGRGIPTGGEIEFADEETLSHSIKRRS